MAKAVIIGLSGEAGLWVVDIDAGTVTALDAPTGGELANANKLRSSGAVVVKGVNLAVAVSSTQSAFSGVFDG